MKKIKLWNDYLSMVPLLVGVALLLELLGQMLQALQPANQLRSFLDY